MEFKKAIKRIVALGTGASMVGATLFGAIAQADLAQYPNQYVKDGAFTGLLVIGDQAAAEDVIGVTNIGMKLQFTATTPVSVDGGTTISAEGDAWKVGTSTKILEMAENVKSGSSNREAIASITTNIDDTELPNVLASTTASNSKGDASYDQRLYFEDATTGYVQLLEDTDDVTADFLYFANGKQIARYELDFSTSLESDVDDSTGSASTTGDYLTDFEDVELTMLGGAYTVVQARRGGSSTGGNITLTLMGGAVRDTLLEGNTKTYTIDGKDYEVTLFFVDENSAKFIVNGDSSRDLLDGESDKVDDITLGVSEILYQAYAGGVHTATFFLGAQKLYIKDTDITDSASSNELKVDDETIDGADSWVEGSDDDTTFKIDKIIVNMTADDDYYVPAGKGLSENSELDEPDLLFTRSWDINYQGLSDEAVEEIAIKASGSDDYVLEFVDGAGNDVRLPLANAPASGKLRMGDNDDDLIVDENQTINRNDYFIVTDETDTDGERKSFGLRYKSADKLSSDDPVIKFEDLGSGDTITRSLAETGSLTPLGNFDEDGYELAQLKLGGASFRVYNASPSEVDNFDIVVDMDGSGAPDTTEGENNVVLNTNYGAKITIHNTTTHINVSIETPNSDDYDDLASTPILYNISESSGEVRLAADGDQNLTLQTPQDDEDNDYAYTAQGAKIKYYSPSSAPQELMVEYPKQQRVPLVYITGESAILTTTAATSEGGAVTVQEIGVEATKLASEALQVDPTMSNNNYILVGGPCANVAAATVMGNPADCLEGFTPGVGRIVMYDLGSGNVAMLVAGYNKEDTRDAAIVVAKYGDYADTLKGESVDVKKVNNVLTVAEPTEEVEEEEEEETEEV